MPLFGGTRDAGLVHRFNMELLADIIDTEVALYKISLLHTNANLYDESDKKIYMQPVKISSLINRQAQVYEGTELGQNFVQQCDFGFIREQLKSYNLFVEVGDIIEYNGEYYEVDQIQDNQYFVGKNPDYSFAGEGWGHSVSIIANTHVTKRSSLNLEEIRSGNRIDNNNLPSNI